MQDEDGAWTASALEGGSAGEVALPGPLAGLRAAEFNPEHQAPVLVCNAGSAGHEWVLVTPTASVRVNGEPVLLNARVLHDRDEISVRGAAPVFFSTEQLACVVPFPGTDAPLRCARCRQPIEKNQLAVQCPGCRTWYHQSPDDPERPYPCWTYSETCVVDEYPTELGAGWRWTPEEV